MSTLLSPRDLATAVGVSESSLKRWVDDGRVDAQRTSGGHRRIPLHEAVRFLRRSAIELAQPSKLGLSDLTSQAVSIVTSGRGDSALLDAVRRGDAGTTRGIVLAEFILSRSFGAVCDGPIAYAMNRLSEELAASGDGVLTARRASDVLTQAIQQVQQLFSPETEDSPRAAVLSLGSDEALPILMTVSVLQECGFAAAPASSPSELGAPSNAAVVCLHVGSPADHALIQNTLAGFARAVKEGTRVVLCGRGVAGLQGTPISTGALIAGSMCELQSIARAVTAQAAGRTARREPASRSK